MLVKVAWQPLLAPLDAPDVRYLVGGSHDVWVILVNVGERMVPQGVLQVGGVGAVTHPLVGGVGAVTHPLVGGVGEVTHPLVGGWEQ